MLKISKITHCDGNKNKIIPFLLPFPQSEISTETINPFSFYFHSVIFSPHKFYIIGNVDRATWASNQKASVFLPVCYVFPHACNWHVLSFQQWRPRKESRARKDLPTNPQSPDWGQISTTDTSHWMLVSTNIIDSAPQGDLAFSFFSSSWSQSCSFPCIRLKTVWLRLPIHLIWKIVHGYI